MLRARELGPSIELEAIWINRALRSREAGALLHPAPVMWNRAKQHGLCPAAASCLAGPGDVGARDALSVRPRQGVFFDQAGELISAFLGSDLQLAHTPPPRVSPLLRPAVPPAGRFAF